ncbi:M23 family metallopeptidase [Sphingomonas piscis]|uniref:M23 family metallopeptidase n=1 Tax=Sphingomonas piscis TaxID=2714943 RepID=A0A6G7YNZ3_9SPHN|nr:M23 family metallopeptidase [Sphingomonas piscis]QIK78462.1 M23 family metallopeptidase [Sphingomonas piscis]
MSSILMPNALFRDRDLFVHDGSKLRRFRLSAPVQMFFFLCMLGMSAWSIFAVVRFSQPAEVAVQAGVDAGVSKEVARIAAATEARVREIEERQAVLAAMIADGKADAETLAQLGFEPSTGKGGVGGPFDSKTQADPTFKALFTSWKKLDTLSSSVISVPSDKPVKTASFESAYGMRSDPFEGRAKMHAGIDLAAPLGTPIYATADGVVTDAGYNNGGYGNLIKLSHGRGIETRYGHLSAIGVHAGQRITRGQLIGRMGSTGRSTGSHLHYEVRIDGRAVNPIPFMKSNDYLVAMRKKVGSHSMDQVALGGPASAQR